LLPIILFVGYARIFSKQVPQGFAEDELRVWADEWFLMMHEW